MPVDGIGSSDDRSSTARDSGLGGSWSLLNSDLSCRGGLGGNGTA